MNESESIESVLLVEAHHEKFWVRIAQIERESDKSDWTYLNEKSIPVLIGALNDALTMFAKRRALMQ